MAGFITSFVRVLSPIYQARRSGDRSTVFFSTRLRQSGTGQFPQNLIFEFSAKMAKSLSFVLRCASKSLWGYSRYLMPAYNPQNSIPDTSSTTT